MNVVDRTTAPDRPDDDDLRAAAKELRGTAAKRRVWAAKYARGLLLDFSVNASRLEAVAEWLEAQIQ